MPMFLATMLLSIKAPAPGLAMQEMPPPLAAVLNAIVLLRMMAGVGKLSKSPPPEPHEAVARLPLTVLSIIVKDAVVMPPPLAARLPEIVEPLTVTLVSSIAKMPPPLDLALFPLTVLSASASDPPDTKMP